MPPTITLIGSKLCEEIFRLKQGSKSVMDYCSFVKGRWEELTLYQPFPQDLANWQCETQYVSTKNQLLLGIEPPPVNVAFSSLSQIPVQMEATPEEDSMALVAVKPSSTTTRGRGRGCGGGRTSGKKEDRHCDFCNFTGLMEDKCWQKHGKPDWAEQIHNSNNASSATRPASANCSYLFKSRKQRETTP